MDFVKKSWDEFTDSKYIMKQTGSIVISMLIALFMLFYTELDEVFVGEFDILWLKVLVLIMMAGAIEVWYNFIRLVALGLRKLYNICVKQFC